MNKIDEHMKWLSSLCLILLMAAPLIGQSLTPNGWKYEVLKTGYGPSLHPNSGILVHNQLVDGKGNTLVSTYQIGVPDYQLVAELSDAFKQAFSVMQLEGQYKFYIPSEDFEAAARSGNGLKLPGREVVWEIELLKILPPLPDGARTVMQTMKNQGTQAAYDHYHQLSLNRQAYFGEWEVNQIGYLFLQKGEISKAVEILGANAERYPNSYNAHDSLAEAYLESGNTELAKRHYQKSLDINPSNTNARQMLRKLK